MYDWGNFDQCESYTRLMGAGHCLAMCGGIISSLSISSSGEKKQNWQFIYIYQLGRIASYTFFGAVAGWLGLHFAHLSPLPILKILSGVLLIAMALYISRVWLGIAQLEKVGKFFWNRVSPLAKYILPVNSPVKALSLGMLWGWLPCGLVYTSLSYSLSLGDSFSGAMFMMFFGIGTLPATIFAGSLSLSLKRFLNNKIVRLSSALVFALMGAYTLYMVLISSGHHMHH